MLINLFFEHLIYLTLFTIHHFLFISLVTFGGSWAESRCFAAVEWVYFFNTFSINNINTSSQCLAETYLCLSPLKPY